MKALPMIHQTGASRGPLPPSGDLRGSGLLVDPKEETKGSGDAYWPQRGRRPISLREDKEEVGGLRGGPRLHLA